MTDDATVRDLTVSVFTVPTDQPEADGTLSWTETTLVVVEPVAADTTGLCWSYATGACATLIEDVLRDVVIGTDVFDVPGTWERMVRRCRNLGRPGIVSMAVAAVDIALWDLKAKLLGVPLCRLLGRARTDVPVYGSGGFTSYDEDALTRQLAHWVHELGIPRVKIKIGESWGTNPERDIARIRIARTTIGEDAELFVDANGGYGWGQAVWMAHAMADQHVVWFEEPVSSDDLPARAAIRAAILPDVAAGEYGYGGALLRADVRDRRRRLPAGRRDPLRRHHRVAQSRRGGRRPRARGVRTLRAEPARPPGRGDPQPAPPRVLPRPRPRRERALPPLSTSVPSTASARFCGRD